MIKNNFEELRDARQDPQQEFVSVFELKDRTKLILVNDLTGKFREQFENAFKNRLIN